MRHFARIILSLFFLLIISSAVHAQRRVQRDTMFIDGAPVAYSMTYWYAIEGDRVPDFAVRSLDGRHIRIGDLRGKVVVISFWIKTCGPCMRELARVGPELVDVYPPENFEFLAIGSGEDRETAQWFSRQCGATFPLCYDPSGRIVGKFADNGFPKVFVVDRQGIIRYTGDGYSPEKFEALKKVVSKLVAE